MSELFNSYETAVLLGYAGSSTINSLARAGHLHVYNAPVLPLSTRRGLTVFTLEELQRYSKREFSREEIERARKLGEEMRLDKLRRERMKPGYVPKGKRTTTIRPAAGLETSPKAPTFVGTAGFTRPALDPIDDEPKGFISEFKPVVQPFMEPSVEEALNLEIGRIRHALTVVTAVFGSDYGNKALVQRAIWTIAHTYEGSDSFDTETHRLAHIAEAL